MTNKAFLALADGRVFEGRAIGAAGTTVGEVVFNTSMSGYQEMITDPSYRYQILSFTYPHIGNVGVNPQDNESSKAQVAGIVVRGFSEDYSNFRAKESLQDYLVREGIVGISGVDTRALTLHLREQGSQNGAIVSGEYSASDAVELARKAPSIEGMNLAKEVSCKKSYSWSQGAWELARGGYRDYSPEELSTRPHVVAIDFGIKYNILRLLTETGFRVTVVPATTSSAEILDLAPNGVFLSNGPGDPAAVTEGIAAVKGLLGKKPIFGICLGHQILGLALGVPTYKLKFGHHGGNHPVRDELTKKVEITSQNHCFATDRDKLPSGVNISHLNLNDQTVEGFDVPDLHAFSVQYHPEAAPGPNDSQYLFKRFYNLVTK
jgi:carbamoyl-phosphate synthase small subunit